MEIEFYCPYCKGWINDTVHRQHHHNYHLQPDRQRDWRIRVDGVVYEDETDYVWSNAEKYPEPAQKLRILLNKVFETAKGGE